MTLENFLDRCPMSNLPHDDGDRDPHSSNACAASYDVRVEGNPVEVDAPSLAGRTVRHSELSGFNTVKTALLSAAARASWVFMNNPGSPRAL